MWFGPVPLSQAQGAILAHSHALPAGRLRKGALLTATDVAALAAAGVTAVTVARPGPGDVDEDAAAAALCGALRLPGLTVTRAATGRANVHADGPGVLLVDAGAVAAVNAVDPGITLATLSPMARVAARTMVATVKIIPYAVPGDALARAVAAAAGALRLAPVITRHAELIVTEMSPGDGPGKGVGAISARMDALGIAMAPPVVVTHDTAAVAAALRAAAATDMLLILTASATSDLGDVAPAAIRAAGGTVERFGMPVDPGNLLILGSLGGRPVIGLPGCARSPAPNGADWVMERLACGLGVTAADIAAMGVGGLLKEPRSRPHPRSRAVARGVD
jgi:molybdenum cofactor cytidylyltransferase